MALGVAFLGVATLLMLRSLWTPSAPQGQLVEVRGDVARPGLYAVDPATLSAAVEAAGGLTDGLPDTPLRDGDAVQVDADGARVVPMGDPLLVALPVNVNVNGVEALKVIPGVTDDVASAIIEERAAHGPFQGVGDLKRVRGLGGAALDRVRPFVTTGATAPKGPVDLNTADALALESLPGVGPSLAARIVVDRQANGPYRSIDALDRVAGVGPATVERLRGQATVEGTP
jgi:competence protein ComEA